MISPVAMSTPPGEMPEKGMFAAEVTTVARAAVGGGAIAAIRIAAPIRRSCEEGIECRVTLFPNSTTGVSFVINYYTATCDGGQSMVSVAWALDLTHSISPSTTQAPQSWMNPREPE